MCCLVEKEMPHKIRRTHSGDEFFQRYNPKKLQKIAREYSSKTLPGIVHGKVELSEYFVIGDKRSVRFVTVPQTTDVAREFQTLADQWKQDTLAVSSVSDIVMHPAYQRIMSMGKRALPLILQELHRELYHWFYALEFIAGTEGKDVAKGADTLEDARSAWLEWGYRHGYL